MLWLKKWPSISVLNGVPLAMNGDRTVSPESNSPVLQSKLSAATQLAAGPLVLGLRQAFEQSAFTFIEERVAAVREQDRSELLLVLVAEEVALRENADQRPNLDEYLERFPQFKERLREAWNDLSAWRLPLAESLNDKLAVDVNGAQPVSSVEPTHFGPYLVLRRLGEGTFGLVYQAQHETSGDIVAVKMLKPEWSDHVECGQEMRAQFAAEAQTMLGFDHPHIVRVLSSHEDANPPYFVQEYIAGRTLREQIKAGVPSLQEALGYAIQIADALAHMHSRDKWHRDLKPENILLDANNRVRVADFGLVLDNAQRWSLQGQTAGTRAYMAPEQIRGRTHLLNARCDLWAFGVVLYELLTGRRPFAGSGDQVVTEILERNPAAPRELDRNIPRKVNRLCMQCLSKRDGDRPDAAADLYDDLRDELEKLKRGRATSDANTLPGLASDEDTDSGTSSTDNSGPLSTAHDQAHSNGTDKAIGTDKERVEYPLPTLRRFTAEQTAMYLRLMPRSYGNEAELPGLIVYWKQRIEDADSDRTFRIGILVGVSGCGKSSLLEAGLLPNLVQHVKSILVEASDRDTEQRLLAKLRRLFPAADPARQWKLADWLFRVRNGGLLAEGEKLVIVVDQFEQWLNAHGGEATNELLEAFEQCDGQRLQAIVCVREGFHATLMRFVESLELVLDADENYATAHRFKPDHARYVLTQFGRGLQRVDDPPSETQQAFLDATIEGLGESDRGVVCVRLVVLALVMQDRPWTVKELESLGGLDGIGAQFLVDCFEGRTASEQYRRYLPAAMRVFEELLPAEGQEIKDVRSYEQLQAASELDRRQFDDLLNILVRKLFLLTSVEQVVAAKEAAEGVEGGTIEDNRSTLFQLTHDFLIPSIREWLSRKLRETKAGRAQLRLQELSTAWQAKPENRNLPSLWEWITIRRLTDRTKWKPKEQAVMRRAARAHAARANLFSTFIIALLLGGLGLKRWNDSRLLERDATNLVSSIESADYANLPEMIAQLDQMRSVVSPKLRQALALHDLQSDERLKLSLALLGSDPGQVEYLLRRLLDAEARQVPLLVEQLEPYVEQILPQLWAAAKRLEPKTLLQAASALAAYDPKNDDWRLIADRTVAQVVREEPLRFAIWIESLHPAASQLYPELKRVYSASSNVRTSTEIDLATDLLATYAAEDFELLHELILVGGPRQFSRVFDLYARFRTEAIERLRGELAHPVAPSDIESEGNLSKQEIQTLRLDRVKRQANAAVALLRLEDATPVYEFLTVDRDLEALCQFIYRIRGREVNPLLLIKSIEELRTKADRADPLQQQHYINRLYGFLLGLGEFTYEELPAQRRDAFVGELAEMYGMHPSRAIHSALGWLLRRWGQDDLVRRVDETPLEYDATGKREWFVIRIAPPPPMSLDAAEGEDLAAPDTSLQSFKPVIDLSTPIYFTMIVFPGGEFAQGESEGSELAEVAGPIAVSDREVTWRQFSPVDGDTHRRSFERHFKKTLGPEDPAFGVGWFDAVNYCRWLTSARGLDEVSQSYVELDFSKGANSRPGWLNLPPATEWPLRIDRPGFRLLTEVEWEYIARSGTETTYCFGAQAELLGEYAWYNENSNEWPYRTGQLRPSIGGLFDIYGNLWEWVDDWHSQGSYRVVCGGGWDGYAATCRSAHRNFGSPVNRTPNLGFRLALSPSGHVPAQPDLGEVVESGAEAD